MNNKLGEKEYWVDEIKIFACILVVLGHFFQSMTKSGIIRVDDLNQYFDKTIYLIHNQIFFICSGYLYQKFSKVNSISSWTKNIEKKVISLGIPYISFLSITWAMKFIMSNLVNEKVNGYLYTIVYFPVAPYWFLYALLFFFFITPTFKNKYVLWIVFCISTALKCCFLHFGTTNIPIMDIFLSNYIWFLLGMLLTLFIKKLKQAKYKLSICALLVSLFRIMSIFLYFEKILIPEVELIASLSGCVGFIVLFICIEERIKAITFFSEYIMPVFLMHTIFAATTRILLTHIGINGVFIHVTIGVLISFVGPVLIYGFMKRTKFLIFFINPFKLINRSK